jgi:hypothetical protein
MQLESYVIFAEFFMAPFLSAALAIAIIHRSVLRPMSLAIVELREQLSRIEALLNREQDDRAWNKK